MKFRALLASIVVPPALFAGGLTGSVAAADYFVAKTGDDQNAGTSLEQPFASVQRAVTRMGPGDTCYIRGGVYREEINLTGKGGAPGKPITLTGYEGEKVTLDGTVKLEGSWALDEGNVYKATVSEKVAQLFVDGKVMTLARFPNAPAFSNEAFHEKNRREKLSASKRRTVIDNPTSGRVEPLADTGIDFTNCIAILNFGDHVTGARVVKNHSAGSDTFNYSPNIIPFKNTRGYFFEGGVGNAERVMLDSAEEWAFDESTMTLYLWADDGKSPAGREVRSKNRIYSVTGDSTTHDIVIDGVDFFATAFYFESSDRIAIRNCDFDYPIASTRALGDTGAPRGPQFKGLPADLCENITVFNCAFRNADGCALRGEGTVDALVENCLFYRVDYAPIGIAGAVNFRMSPGFVYRRNTLDTSGDSMGMISTPTSRALTKPWTCEYNFHTRCGLMEADGSSVYSAHEAIVESVGRYNWFIGNDARDYRWDGHNRPKVLGLNANFYRNVMMADRIKGIATGGDGARLKGDFHEVYNNVGIYKWSDIDVALDKGGNAHSLTRNNASDKLTGNVKDPAVASNNHFGNPPMGILLRDPDNWDFRPRAGRTQLIDQGVPTTCRINGKTVDVTAGFNGRAPDIGAYEAGDGFYWIPGRQEAAAAMPVPRADGEYVQLDTDLMYLIGLGGVSAKIYFGSAPDELSLLASKTHPENIVKLSDFTALKGDSTYYWRVDTVLADSTVIPGEVWSFTTMLERTFISLTKRSLNGGATWLQRASGGALHYENKGKAPKNRALIYSSEAFQSDGGFRLKVGYTTGLIGSAGAHQLSFGLISTDTDLSSYAGFNPFKSEPGVYSLGVNLTGDPAARGLNFTDGKVCTTLDESGTHVQFGTHKKFQFNESNLVVIDIDGDGNWSYSINGITEATGKISGGFDLTKSYRVAVYGQDDNKDGKAIQHISLYRK
ncbi:MAG: hypothetical protein P1U86_07920 [Verrucomicrobiales bacterium]|nr:hypothetical protein [Verrucomicrobiales bacterium]